MSKTVRESAIPRAIDEVDAALFGVGSLLDQSHLKAEELMPTYEKMRSVLRSKFESIASAILDLAESAEVSLNMLQKRIDEMFADIQRFIEEQPNATGDDIVRYVETM